MDKNLDINSPVIIKSNIESLHDKISKLEIIKEIGSNATIEKILYKIPGFTELKENIQTVNLDNLSEYEFFNLLNTIKRESASQKETLDCQYEKILYFFKEHNITNFNQGMQHLIDNLYFIPGVNDITVSLVKILANYFGKQNSPEEVPALTTEKENGITLDIKYNSKLNPDANWPNAEGLDNTADIDSTKKLGEIDDVPESFYPLRLSDIFNAVPSGQIFVDIAETLGKFYVYDLLEIDFFQLLKNVKGFNSSKITKFLNIWKQSLNIEKNDNLRNEFLMGKVFGGISHGNLFIEKCKMQDITSFKDLLNFSFNSTDMKGISPDAMIEIRQAFLNSFTDPLIIYELGQTKIDEYMRYNSIENEPYKKFFLDNNSKTLYKGNIIISEGESELLDIKIPYAFQFTVYAKEIIQLATEKNKVWISDLNEEFFNILGSGISTSKQIKIRKTMLYWRQLLSINDLSAYKEYLYNFFNKGINSLDNRSLLCLEKKTQGGTLASIGMALNVTRERARQLLKKISQKFSLLLIKIGDILLEDDDKIDEQEVSEFFHENELLIRYFYFLTKQSNFYQYFRFANLFVRKSIIPSDTNKLLKVIGDNLFKEGVLFSERSEDLEEELEKHNLTFFSTEDFKAFLVHSGYRFYGDYVTRQRSSYAHACYSIVLTYFNFDVQLQQLKQSADMKKIREIAAELYPDISLPSDRALTARLSDYLIASGFGKYCPIEKVVYNPTIFHEIYNYIWESEQSSFYYRELFMKFKGKFLFETNIDNEYFLHGMMKYLYPEDFRYERDLLQKKGENRENIDSRLNLILESADWTLSREALHKRLPGFNDWTFSQAAARLPEVIQWGYNEFIHTSKLQINSEDITILNETIEKCLSENNGYASEKLVYKETVKINPHFIEVNKLSSSISLFYILSWLFSTNYKFSRPHIFRMNEMNATPTFKKVIQEQLTDLSTVNYDSLLYLRDRFLWSKASSENAFKDFLKPYIRISIDTFVAKDSFIISDDELSRIITHLASILPSTGYLALFSINDFSDFPSLNMLSWNGFLLQSLIENFETGFRLLLPENQDRRFIRGIIINSQRTENSYEQLVINLLREERIKEITEEGFMRFLIMKGLSSSNNIPQEFYNSDQIKYTNETFKIL